MKKLNTFRADIYCGLRKGYGDVIYKKLDVIKLCSGICNEIKLCVTVTDTHFVYVNGDEPGVIVGLINYPRFPEDPYKIKEKAIEIAQKLMASLEQERVSIVCTDETIMLERDSLDHDPRIRKPYIFLGETIYFLEKINEDL